jgi:transcriptional regulator with XRE-family HTH domain
MLPMAKRTTQISEQLRELIDASGRSRYSICKATGIAEPAMSRFMNGKGGLSLEAIDKVADLLGLTLTASKPAPKSKGKRHA